MKILMICNTDGALYVFRRPIIEAAMQLGHSVHTLSDEGGFIARLQDLGVAATVLNFSRHSVGLTKNLALLLTIWRHVRAESPDVVHCFTHKPAVYGTLAAWLSGVPSILVTITGLGTLFIRTDIKAVLLRHALLLQYRLALRLAKRVYFQNPDDLSYFTERGIVSSRKATLTGGSGIDLAKLPLPSQAQVVAARTELANELGQSLAGRQIILFPARAVREKGFFEFYGAAKTLNSRHPGRYLFLHLGLVDPDSSGSIAKAGIHGFAQECGVVFLGFKDDIARYMTACDVVALPSYREGTPRSLIEALALGKVVITTDAPGCRETVINGVTGLLCEPRSEDSLVDCLERVDSAFIEQARETSRRLCEEKFDVAKLVQTTLRDYQS